MVNQLYFKARTKFSNLGFGKIAAGLVILVLVIISFYRVVTVTATYLHDDLQMDFSAFYTAGDALNHGLDPYKNNVGIIPTVWDGFDRYTFSRFLYPPLAATLFRPLALVGYPEAKLAWTIISLAGLALSMFLFVKTFNRPGDKINWWPVALIFVGFFFPLTPFVERGQVDAVTLLFISAALFVLLKKPEWAVTAGVLLAFATLLKLNCVYFIPFLLLRKQYKATIGYLAGGVLIVALTLLFNGVDNTFQYVFTEFPRISANGENGTPAQQLPRTAFLGVQGGTGHYVTKEDTVYAVATIEFQDNASLSKAVNQLFTNLGLNLNMSLVSAGVLVVFFLVVLAWELWHKAGPWSGPRSGPRLKLPPRQEFLFWQMVLVIILMASPLTWMMNTIWVIPLFFLPVYYFTHPGQLNSKISMPLLILGLLLIALPDLQNGPFTVRRIDQDALWVKLLTDYSYCKYFVGELFVFGGLLSEYLPKASKAIPPAQAEPEATPATAKSV